MATTLQVDIVTPERLAFTGSALEVRVPGVHGEFGVLPDHTEFLSLLRAGIVSVSGGGNDARYIIGRGFAEAAADHVVILTDSCESVADVDKAEAQRLLDQAEAVLADSAPGSDARLTAEQQAELARARLSV